MPPTRACRCTGSAREAVHGLVLKETDKQFYDQRIAHAAVNIADDEAEIDLLAGSDFWCGDCCAPPHLCQSHVLCFCARAGAPVGTRKVPRAQSATMPNHAKSTWLSATGYVDDFAIHILKREKEKPNGNNVPVIREASATAPVAWEAQTTMVWDVLTKGHLILGRRDSQLRSTGSAGSAGDTAGRPGNTRNSDSAGLLGANNKLQSTGRPGSAQKSPEPEAKDHFPHGN